METLEEKIKKFLYVSYGSGYGDGSGSGYGDGSGYGYGSGYGSGDGDGYGSGYDDSDGRGTGDGSGYKILSINNKKTHKIDGVQTVITHVKENIAKGFIIASDLTLTYCYIAKVGGKFAHGKTPKEALEYARQKQFEDMDEEKRIDLFLEEFTDIEKKYSAKDFYDWHNKLTGSCEMGRDEFLQRNNIDLEKDYFTVKEFIKKTKNDFGSDVICMLEKRINE